MKTAIFFLTILTAATVNAAGKTEIYTGEARTGDKIVYIEKHTVQTDDKGKVTTALTEYVDSKGAPIATLKSNFSTSLSTPEYDFKDVRLNHLHGIRREGSDLVLYKQDKGEEKPTTKILKKEDDNRVAFGCQGLNYYLNENMELVNQKRKLPIIFVTPGNLGAYNFELIFKSEADGIVSYDIEIDNWLLKIFAPKLEIKYDKNKKRIVWYKGLSNIQNEQGKNQVVVITYQYSS